MSDTKFTLLTVSSLDKIFPDEPFQPQTPCTGAAMFLNERFSFQAAYCLEGPQILHANVALSGSLKDEVVFRQTGLVPSELFCFKKQKLSYLIFPAGNGNMLKLRFFQSRPFYENIMGNYRIPQQKIYKQNVLKVFFN